MDDEMIEIVEVEAFDSRGQHSPDLRIDLIDSKSIHWLSPEEARHLCRLDKSAMQRAVSELVAHGILIEKLRRGQARRTEYSRLAVDLIKALKSGDESTFQELKSSALTVDAGGSIVCVAEHFEVAVAASSHAIENRGLIRQEMAGLFDKFDVLADAIGDKIVARMDERITGKVRAGIKKIGES